MLNYIRSMNSMDTWSESAHDLFPLIAFCPPSNSPLKLVTAETFHSEMSPQRVLKCCRWGSLAVAQASTAALRPDLRTAQRPLKGSSDRSGPRADGGVVEQNMAAQNSGVSQLEFVAD